jgi:N-acetylmuramic acid 6-phosphate etherase
MHTTEEPGSQPQSEVQPAGIVPATGRLPALESERSNTATREIDRMSPLQIVQAMNAEDASVAIAVATELPQIARAIEVIAARLRRGGRLIYIGAGTSGRLGALDAAECPPTFNVTPETIVSCIAGGAFAWTAAVEDAEDRADLGEADLAALALGEADAVVGIAASGRTPYVLGALGYARSCGALTIGIACNRDTPLERLSEIAIAPVVGPEVIAGSTRLKAGTAQKMILNMLSTGTMILLGKTFGNLMVDVRATNEKLRQRAIEIVAQACALDLAAAGELLAACDGEIKTAIVANRAGVTPEEARARLAALQGIVRKALDAADEWA